MAKGKPESRQGKGMLAWRSRQRPGAIMKSSTFDEIVKKCLIDNPTFSEERCKTIAGSAYWKTAKAKYKERVHRYA